MLEIQQHIITFLDKHFVDGAFMSVLVILYARLFVKTIDTTYALAIIAWFLFLFACIGVLYWFVILLTIDNEIITSTYFNRAEGPYKVAYFVMFASSFLPMFLLIKSLRRRIFVVLAISILMNFGWLMESFIIHTTSMHRDYSSQGWISGLLPNNHEVIILIKGIVVGALALILGNFISRRHALAQTKS